MREPKFTQVAPGQWELEMEITAETQALLDEAMALTGDSKDKVFADAIELLHKTMRDQQSGANVIPMTKPKKK